MSDLTDSLKWELKKSPLFQDLDEETFDSLLNAATPKIIKARTNIFHEGDEGGSMLMVLSGQIKISTIAPNGKECVLAFLGPGDVIGELTVFDGGARNASAQAMEPSRLLELTRGAVISMLEESPSTAIKIIEILCKRLRATSAMVEDATLLAAAPRLARALLRLIETNGVKTDDGVLIDLALSQGTLGAHAGLLRESVNRQMRAWEKDGVISRRDDRIVILQQDQLIAITEASE